MRADFDRMLKRMEGRVAALLNGPPQYHVTLVCMCGWERLDAEHVCRPEPPPRRPGVIVISLD